MFTNPNPIDPDHIALMIKEFLSVKMFTLADRILLLFSIKRFITNKEKIIPVFLSNILSQQMATSINWKWWLKLLPRQTGRKL